MLVKNLVLTSLTLASSVLGHSLPGRDSLLLQLAARATNPIDSVYNDLGDTEIDWINDNLKPLTAFNGTKCDACKNKLKYGQQLILDNPDKKHLVSLLLFKYCLFQNNGTESKCDNLEFFVTTNSKNFEAFTDNYDSGVVSGTTINFYDNDLLHVLQLLNTSSDLDLSYYCAYKSGGCKVPETPDVEELYGISSWWPEKQDIHKSEPQYANNSEIFNVLHVTDLHIQLRYKLGTESNCSVTPCCLPESFNKEVLPGKDYNFTDYYKSLDPSLGDDIRLSFYPDAHYDDADNYVAGEYYDFPKHRGWNFNTVPAGTFGAYQCDSPEILLNNSFKYISQAHADKNFEFTVFTGDLVDHDVAHCDPETTKTAEIKSFNIMKHYLKNIPVFPSLGNHDTFPYGQVSPIKYDFNNSYDWNTDLMSELWVNNAWLPEELTQQIKTHYSGFSYVTDRGLKVISLNSNCYYQKNLWSYIDISTNPDLFGQWEFLVNELIESEKIGQRVWIMAHIPVTDYDTLPLQSRIFGKIVERFSPYTIANIFYGHTHQDQFHILYSSDSAEDASNIVNMAWVAQSITPLGGSYNPSWRYYEVENESFNIINSFNYFTRLNETFVNGGGEPAWQFEYSARDTFDPNGEWPVRAPLNATFWDKFVVQNLKNESNIEFNQLYTDIQYRYGPEVPVCKNGTVVSDDCYNENYCIVANFYSDDYNDCLR